jgi:hypothetical protein
MTEIVGMILFIELFILTVASGIYYIVNSIRTSYLYILDGADSRSVAVACFSPIYVLAVIMGLKAVVIKYISAEIDIFIVLTYLAFLVQLLRGRLIGYPSTRIALKNKNILFIFTCVFFLIALGGTIASYRTNAGFIINNYSYENISKTVFSFLSISFLKSPILIVFTLLPSIMFTIFIIYFDWKEHRSKKTLFQDRLLFIPIIIHIVFNFIPYNFITGTIAHFAFHGIIIIIFAHMRDEFESIFRLSEGVNSKIASCNRLIEILAEKKDFSRNDLVKIKFIAEQVKKDEFLKETTISKPCWFNSKKRRVIYKIREALSDL